MLFQNGYLEIAEQKDTSPNKVMLGISMNF